MPPRPTRPSPTGGTRMRKAFSRALIAAAWLAAAAASSAQTPLPTAPAPAAAPAAAPAPAPAPVQGQAPVRGPAPASRTVTFDEAVATALEKNLDVARAAQAILRAEALLQSA